MSLSCALWATSLQQWARRYIRVTQPARCSPEKRARMRAFFANGAEKMHIPLVLEGLPTLLHLSLFLFFGGLIIFLFNVDQEVFLWVVSWIGFFSGVYGLITLLPLIRQDSPYYSPLSILAWFLYAGIRYVTIKFLVSTPDHLNNYKAWRRYHDSKKLYRAWMLGGVEKKAEEMVEKQSLKIDVGVLGWTISALGDDHSLEKFIEAIPGFFNSKSVNDLREHLPDDVSRRLTDALDGFLDRSLSSNSVIDSVKLHRLDISLSAINLLRPFQVWFILEQISYRDQVPKTVEIWHTLAPWFTSNNQLIARYARGIVAEVFWTVRERSDRWFELAAQVYGLPERDLRDITHDDNSMSLAIFIQVTRKAFRSDLNLGVLEAFTQFDIRHTLSGLQHDFCTLWNEIVQEAKKRRPYSLPVAILREIRHHYIALHQGTDAAPTALSPSTRSFDDILFEPSSYPLCDIASHRTDCVPLPLFTQPFHSPNASPHHSISGGSTISRQVNEATIIARPTLPSHATIPCEIGDSSQAPTATSPALRDHTSPCPTDASPPGAVAAALQNISLAAILSHHREVTTHQDIVVPCTEPDVIEILSTASLPAPAPTPTYTSDPLPPASSIVGFSVPASPQLSHVPPFPNAESATLLGSATPSHSTGNATLPRLRARGLVNTGSMCFANAMLQLLVHSPPFWELFIRLGDLKGLRRAGVPETSSGATPLVDATLRFFEEFRSKEKNQPPAQESPQQVAEGKSREQEAKKEEKVDSFESSYMYDAIKEKIQLKNLLVRYRATYHPAVTNSCWSYV